MYQRISVSAYQRISVSAYQRISVSAYQRSSVSAYQRISVSAYQRISESAYQCISASAHQRISVSAYQRISVSEYQRISVGIHSPCALATVPRDAGSRGALSRSRSRSSCARVRARAPPRARTIAPIQALTLCCARVCARVAAQHVNSLPAKQRQQTRCSFQRPHNHHLCPCPTTSHNSKDKLSRRQRHRSALLHACMPTLAACRLNPATHLSFPPLNQTPTTFNNNPTTQHVAIHRLSSPACTRF